MYLKNLGAWSGFLSRVSTLASIARLAVSSFTPARSSFALEDFVAAASRPDGGMIVGSNAGEGDELDGVEDTAGGLTGAGRVED